LESSDEYNFLNIIIIFEKWRRNAKKITDLFTREKYYCSFLNFKNYKKRLFEQQNESKL